ncbi:hypothetical protein [Aeromicrobium chenweiae]|uniref:Uncharacterized protein n=1 Tax=Aeromicrobium chenweiae TaxID=2079793 RepID=A0A2S0WLM6_9ACTN|nr:hypothetical protein [Aeromicrobium chenweiae]AWB92174.1 hypothetical protein C3E78_08160 [Aeromicrobium chenweiae]
MAATAKHTWSVLGPAALLPLIPLGLLSVWVVIEGWRRYDDDQYYRVYRAIGGPTFVLALTTALAAVLEAIHLFAARGVPPRFAEPCTVLTAPFGADVRTSGWGVILLLKRLPARS